MYSVDVFGAFDFLPEEIFIGTLDYERVKGSPSCRLRYDKGFLERFPNLSLSADLGKFLGIQASNDGLFSFLGDALPDRWGRALLDKKERIDAKADGRLPRKFDDFGYLIRIDDELRMGALRFKYNGKYLGVSDSTLRVPPIAQLDTYIREAQMLEEAEISGISFHEQWLSDIWKPGSSLGGARPKLNVVDEHGNLWIAKIPSFKDSYDVALWEHFALLLAKSAGINAAESYLLQIGPTPYHTLLSKRFDRAGSKRIHFASSLTLTGLHDGDNATNDKGYIDIADAMAGDIGIRSLEAAIVELYRRAAYNILIGNHDDHFRNHGFLLRQDGWELCPAYDINPSIEIMQTLAVTPYSNNSSIRELFDSCEFYLIRPNMAEEIIREVCSAVVEWRKIAKQIGITEIEQRRFAKRIDWSLAEAKELFPEKRMLRFPLTFTMGPKNGRGR